MPYTNNPGEVPADEVRFLIGDTDTDNELLTDVEIEYLLSKTNEEPIRAAYQAAQRLLARFSRQVSKTVGPTRIDYEARVTNYRGLLADLAAMGGDVGIRPLAFGGGPIAAGLDDDFWSDVTWTVVPD